MAITFRIPTPLRNLTGGADTVSADGASDLGAAISALDEAHPGLKERLCDERGDLRRFVNIYINGEDVRFLDGLGSTLKDGDEVSIVPAVAGGCRTVAFV
jgi:sulfur-carrier protein